MSRLRWWAVVVPALLVLAGCGSPARPGAVPVGGTVTLNGAPVANARVTFIPADGTTGFGGAGTTDAAGKYVIKDARESTPGVVPGKYRVVVSKRINPDGSEVPADDTTPMMASQAKESLGKYGNLSAPALERTVPDGGGTVDLPLELKDTKKKK